MLHRIRDSILALDPLDANRTLSFKRDTLEVSPGAAGCPLRAMLLPAENHCFRHPESTLPISPTI